MLILILDPNGWDSIRACKVIDSRLNLAQSICVYPRVYEFVKTYSTSTGESIDKPVSWKLHACDRVPSDRI